MVGLKWMMMGGLMNMNKYGIIVSNELVQLLSTIYMFWCSQFNQ